MVTDPRDIATVGQWWDRGSIDPRGMTARLLGYVVEIKFEACGLCAGRGSYVDPSIDAHGITREEMAELGPEFAENYRGGMYDVTCGLCGGARVVPVPTSETVRGVVWDLEGSRYEDEAQSAAERRVGA